MTVTYTHEVADCRGFGCFWKLLLRWKGSVYKLVWPDLLAYTALYYLISCIYRFALSETQKREFEKVAIYCQSFSDLIPVSFVLGFYVSIVVQRWWTQYTSLPWPDSLSLFVSTSIQGQDERGRLMRRTIVRFANLAFTITLSMISPVVKKRFPTIDHFVDAGFLTANEKKIFNDIAQKSTHPTYWMPLVWAGAVVTRARKEGRIRDDFAVKTIIDEINQLRGRCGSLLSFDWISIPLVYTQVVTLAVYMFFLATLMSSQFLDPAQGYDKHTVDFYFPVFTYLQFFFYMGWLKVAESLVNPFGEDDDDFEVNWLIDRNLQVSYLIVDEMHNEHPDLIQDIYWDEVYPQELPYTVAAQEFKISPPLGSTANIEVPEIEQEFLPTVQEEVENGPGGVKSHSIPIGSPRDSVHSSSSGLSPGTFSGRKNSVVSFIQAKMGFTASKRQNSEAKSIAGSVTSGRRYGVSRRSARPSSRTSHYSPKSVSRNPTNVSMKQDSEIFHMSQLSLNEITEKDEETLTTSPKDNKSHEEDGAILINVKGKDKDGREKMPPTDEAEEKLLEEYNEDNDSSIAQLIPEKNTTKIDPSIGYSSYRSSLSGLSESTARGTPDQSV